MYFYDSLDHQIKKIMRIIENYKPNLIMQNLIFFMEPSEDLENISLKAGMLYLNRFCIDEDAAHEISGVYYLKKSSQKLIDYMNSWENFETSEYKAKYIAEYTAKCEMISLFYQDLFFLWNNNSFVIISFQITPIKK